MKRSSRFTAYRRALRALRAECPIAMNTPVRVRLVHYPTKYFGLTQVSRNDKYINITVYATVKPKGMPARPTTGSEMLDAIVHEWAHAMSWVPDEHHNVDAHDAVWGVNYAKCYSAAVDG